MRFGQAAIDALVDGFPDAHTFFGEFKSAEHMGVLISSPNWIVMEYDECWLICERQGLKAWEAHWFCPRGVRLGAMRRLLDAYFRTTGANHVSGKVPAGHRNERAARITNRALGARKWGSRYILTKDRHIAYNGRATERED